jgi:predicted enzyme related to lactoylglutathione lyase
MKLSSVMIGSSNAEGLIEYYKNLLGKPAMEEQGWAGWQLGDGWIVMGPHDGVNGTNNEPGRVMFNFESADVKGDFEKLRESGAIVVKEPYVPEGAPEGGLVATLGDPDGNYFQLMSPM